MSGLIDSFFGSSKETTVNQLPSQMQDIQATNEFKSGTMLPAYKDYMAGARTGYQEALPGMMKAAQGGAGYAGQVGQVMGETGESAARTGITGLEDFFRPGYGQEQFAAAMAPIQAQYQQNVANQSAQFGGAGQLGSARQALAGQQMAGATQSAQMQAAANVMNQLNQQRLQAGQALGQLGGSYLNQGLGAKQAQLGFAERPMDWYSTLGKQYASVPSGMYQAQYPGQQDTTSSSTPSLFDIGAKVLPFFL